MMDNTNHSETLAKTLEKITLLKENLNKALRGKADVVELAITTLLAGGHLLIEDVPGVGKTTLARALAESIDAVFKRIQFTSDLMPSDVIGVNIYNDSTREFEFRHGPIFANIVLADEINRATPKTQSALLEAMGEEQVSVENITYALPRPFMLIATQNPTEYAGTFPLPESQLDRFMLSIEIGYPDEDTERGLLSDRPGKTSENLKAVLTSKDLLQMQSSVSTVIVEEDLSEYIVNIVQKTRSHDLIRQGVSPRGTIALHRACQALALIKGRTFCTPDDIKQLAAPALAHRIIVTREAKTEHGVPSLIIEEILTSIEVPV